jgi:formylglycine-generating enzyme required for sulfatase activity
MSSMASAAYLCFGAEHADGAEMRARVALVQVPRRPRENDACWREIALPLALVRRLHRLRERPLENATLRFELGAELFSAFPAELQSELWRMNLTAHRVLLDALGAPSFAALPWQILRCEAPQRTGQLRRAPEEQQAPFESGKWHLVRTRGLAELRDPRSSRHEQLRVLVLVGSQIQGGEAEPSEFSVGAALQALVEALDLTGERAKPIARSTIDVAFASGVTGLEPSALEPRQLRNAEELQELLRENDYDVLHFLGHSDATRGSAGRAAEALMLDFAERPGTSVTFAWLGEVLRGSSTRLFVLHACRSELEAAEPLLEVADHLIGCDAFVPPAFAAAWCRPFYEQLAAEQSIEAALRLTTKQLAASTADDVRALRWLVAHHSAVLRPAPFVSREEQLLCEYRARVIDAHRDLHGGLASARLEHELEHVPVALELRIEGARDAEERFRLETRQSATSVEKLLKEPQCEHALIGKPGAGKTTSLRYAARRIARSDEHRLPLFVRLAEWAAPEQPRGTSGVELLDWSLERLGFGGERQRADRELLIQILTRYAERGGLVLLFDGLDEVPEAGLASVRALLYEIRRTHGASWACCPLLLSSRPYEYQRPHEGLKEAFVLDLSPARQLEVLELWFRHAANDADIDPRTRSEALWRAIDADPVRRELAATPLFIVLFALLATDARADAPAAEDLPGVLRHFVRILLQREHHERGRRRAIEYPDEARRLLGIIALRLVETGQVQATRRQLEAWLEDPTLPPSFRRDLAKWKDAKSFLREVAEISRVLQPTRINQYGGEPFGGDNMPWRFWHRFFADALVGEALVDLKQDPLGWVKSRVAEAANFKEEAERDNAIGFLHEPLALLAAEHRHGAALVESLAEQKLARPIALRVLEIARGLPRATLERVLTTCTNLDERCAFLESVGKSARLELLPLLKRRIGELPHNRRFETCQELWFLDEALLRIGRAHRETRAEIHELRAAIHDPAWMRERLRPEIAMIKLPEGSYTRGDEKNGPPMRVRITADHALSRTHVTLEQYRAFEPTHTHIWGEMLELPVTEISYYESELFCRWWGWDRWQGLEGRLPTESEHEYAARAEREGLRSRLADDEEAFAEISWYWENSQTEEPSPPGWDWSNGRRPHPVATKLPNDWGIYDLYGNVWCWCADWWADYTPPFLGDVWVDPLGPDRGPGRVLRGGCFWSNFGDSSPAARVVVYPAYRNFEAGFRVALAPTPEFGGP